jgi:lipoyl(octanoyl) transferase
MIANDITRTTCVVKYFGIRQYQEVWQQMSDFTSNRTVGSVDEVWVVEHPPVFTLGQASKAEHLLNVGDIPVVQTDRGGQVTYHGPGQIVIYPLLDLRQKNLGVKSLVNRIEESVIDSLSHFGLDTVRKEGAPGIYDRSSSAKIAALGLRIRQMKSFHGLSVNVAMDLSPFTRINPCGYAGMPIVDMQSLFGRTISTQEYSQIRSQLLLSLCDLLNLEIKITAAVTE